MERKKEGKKDSSWRKRKRDNNTNKKRCCMCWRLLLPALSITEDARRPDAPRSTSSPPPSSSIPAVPQARDSRQGTLCSRMSHGHFFSSRHGQVTATSYRMCMLRNTAIVAIAHRRRGRGCWKWESGRS